jgi:hypothetical protein
VPIFGNYFKFHYGLSLKPQINKNIYCHVQNILPDNVFNFHYIGHISLDNLYIICCIFVKLHIYVIFSIQVPYI